MGLTVQKSCDGKVRYENEIAVQYHISSSNTEGSEDYYPCGFCGGFHVFTIPGKRALSEKRVIRNYQFRNKIGPPKMKMRKSNSGRKRK